MQIIRRISYMLSNWLRRQQVYEWMISDDDVVRISTLKSFTWTELLTTSTAQPSSPPCAITHLQPWCSLALRLHILLLCKHKSSCARIPFGDITSQSLIWVTAKRECRGLVKFLHVNHRATEQCWLQWNKRLGTTSSCRHCSCIEAGMPVQTMHLLSLRMMFRASSTLSAS